MTRTKTWIDRRWDDAYAVFNVTAANVADEDDALMLMCGTPIVAERLADLSFAFGMIDTVLLP